MLRLLKNTLLVAVALCTSVQASAQLMESDNPPKENPVYEIYDVEAGVVLPAAVYPAPVEKVTLPKGCVKRNWFGVYVCKRSRSLELALEREMFALIQNGDAQGLEEWSTKAENYARRSGTPYKGRILTHIAIVAGALGDLVTPLTVGREAEVLEPHNVAVQGLNRIIEASAEFSLGTPNLGAATIRTLDLQEQVYHHPTPTEGAFAVGMTLMQTTVPELVQEGIDRFQDPETGELTEAGALTSSIAPFKAVGSYIHIAQAKAFLQDRAGAEEAMGAAYDWGANHRMPAQVLARVKEIEEEILGQDGLYDQWANGLVEHTGSLRSPMVIGQRLQDCVTCHTGTSVPDFQYSYKAWW